MAASLVSEEDVRMLLMDLPEFNTLVDNVRFSPEQIEAAIENTVDRYNLTMPFTGNSYSVENFPYKHLLLLGTAGHLLRSAALNEASNNFSYSADGVQINDKDKTQVFASLGNNMWGEFLQMTKDIKVSQNINQVWGGKASEYNYIGRY